MSTSATPSATPDGAVNGSAPAAGAGAARPTGDGDGETPDDYLRDTASFSKKRKVAAGQTRSSKRRNANEPADSPAGTAGGWLAIQGDLFMDPIVIFTTGSKYATMKAEEVPQIHRRAVDVWRRLTAFCPVIVDIVNDKRDVVNFGARMNNTRTADRSNFRTTSERAVGSMIDKHYFFDLSKIEKSQRGIYNDDICKLFLPPGTADTAQQRLELRTGEHPRLYPRDESRWPLFMWLLCKYNKENILEGLFKSYLIAASIRAIVLGPMAGANGAGNAGHGNTSRREKYKITRVSIENIAFGAVTVHTILNSDKYASDSSVFSYLKFYNRIINTFGTFSASRQETILEFYQTEVFAVKSDADEQDEQEKDVVAPDPDSPEGIMERAIAAEREEEERAEKARREREAAANQQGGSGGTGQAGREAGASR